MEMFNSKNIHHKSKKGSPPIEHFKLLRNNWVILTAVILISLIVSFVYAYLTPDVYTSTTAIKIADPKGNVLTAPLGEGFGGFGGMGKDRFIANEIKTLNNVTIKQMVADIIVDTLQKMQNTDMMNLTVRNDDSGKIKPVPAGPLTGVLSKTVMISQPAGLDFIEISATSPSSQEAALIANSYAEAYKQFNLMENRRQFTKVKDFLLKQSQEKLSELILAENDIKAYQLEGGAVELDRQAAALISKLTDFESQKNATKIELSLVKERLDELKKQLKQRDPSLSNFLNNQSTEPYMKMLQDQIAKVETQKDIALASSNISPNSPVIKQYDSTLSALKQKLREGTEKYRSSVLSSSPEEIKALMQKIADAEVEYQSLNASYSTVNQVIGGYEGKFNQLPASTLELARLERERQTLEKLYLILEEKYQEALVNEQSVPSNVYVLNEAFPTSYPSGPNRTMIPLIGLFIGLVLGIGYVYVKNFFDVTVKSPDDIISKNYNMIGWIPKANVKGKESVDNIEIVSSVAPGSIPSEAFKTLRTRIHFSKIVKDSKTLLVTSAAPGEGKSVVSSNLGITFANAETRTVIVDCDLRRPMQQNFYNIKKSPGLVDYFLGQVSYETIIRETNVKNLSIITAGQTPPNPSEIISSPRMKALIDKLKEEFDLVVIDSPPIMSVTDSEILARLVDMSALVVSANETKVEWMEEAADLLNTEQKNFLGIILNNYNYKEGYKSYYSYYSYGSNGNGKSGSKKDDANLTNKTIGV